MVPAILNQVAIGNLFSFLKLITCILIFDYFGAAIKIIYRSKFDLYSAADWLEPMIFKSELDTAKKSMAMMR